MKSTFSCFCKYFKNPYEAAVASSAFVPENSSSKMQKCLLGVSSSIISKISLHLLASAWNKLSLPLVSGMFK